MTRVKGARELQARLEAIGDTRGMLDTVATNSVRYAKQNTRAFRKTGNTGRTIKKERVTDTSAVISAGGAAVYLEGGTRAHPIRARRARALRFTVTGGQRLTGSPRRGAPVVFARSVRHPGTKPQPFMRPAVEKATREMDDVIEARWDGAA